MLFDDNDLDIILEATGQPVTVTLSGVTVKTIQAKFRKDYQAFSPFESQLGSMQPAMTCKTSDLADITSSHTFLIDDTEYKFDGKPEEKPSGLCLVRLSRK